MSKDLPIEIKRRLAKLDALEAGGVDNWEWYDESLKTYRATIALDERAEEIVSEIVEVICTQIEEPAGRGAGYGMKQSGMDDIYKIVRPLLANKGEK